MKLNIHCALCERCKVALYESTPRGALQMRARCAKDRWIDAAGKQKTYSLHSVMLRRVRKCGHYKPMTEDAESDSAVLREIEGALPEERELIGSINGYAKGWKRARPFSRTCYNPR